MKRTLAWLAIAVAGTALYAAPAAAQNACRWAFNNQCDEPIPGGTGQCPPGTDQADCSRVMAPPVAPAPIGPPITGGGYVLPTNVVYEVQAELRRIGYDPGPLDGRIGPRTRAAIRRFQQDYGHQVTGVATADLLSAIKSVR